MTTKLFNFKARWLLVPLVLFTIGSGNVWGALRSDWTLVTAADQITAGGTYIIAYNSGSASTHTSVVPMRNETNAKVGTSSGSTYIYSGTSAGSSGTGAINMENSALDLSAYEVTIVAGSAANSYAIQLSNGNYIGFYGTSNNNVALYTSVVARCSFTVSVSSSNKWTLCNVNSTSRYFKYNTSGRYSNYASTSGSTGPVVIYKKTQTCTLSSISLNTTSVQETFCVGDALNYTGLVTTATYTGGCANATVTPTSVTVPSGAMNTAGSKMVTVRYTEGGVTKTATYTITVNAKYSVTWMVNGSSYSTGSPTTQVCPGSHVTSLPTAPDPASYCGEVFAGWTDEEYSGDSAPTNLYKTASEFPNATGNQTFYAVFADYAP